MSPDSFRLARPLLVRLVDALESTAIRPALTVAAPPAR